MAPNNIVWVLYGAAFVAIAQLMLEPARRSRKIQSGPKSSKVQVPVPMPVQVPVPDQENDYNDSFNALSPERTEAFKIWCSRP